jgi:hypothetical protein
VPPTPTGLATEAPPTTIELTDGEPTNLPPTRDTLILTGTGTIQPATGETITVQVINVTADGIVTANGLKVVKNIQMTGKSKLMAAAGDKITLEPNVRIVFESSDENVPFLDLGNIGDNYTITPEKFAIELQAVSFKPADGFRHTLLQGETLTNCEDWIEIAEYDKETFTVTCEEGGGEGGRGLRARVRRLVVKGRKDARGADSDDGLPPGAIVAIVIAGVVLLVGVAILAFILVKRSRKSGSSSSSVSSDKSNSMG